ncbi:DUF488 domain-containing protein [Varunaivibrio sulfuroxidans]|nr:DUF488 family protein [Varunaivibrio sulfuroxidans]WES32220.1 DUF488 family protein [Varunaivibrio sulfuroxidans]
MRYWPRGCNRDQFDMWLPDLAPSRKLLAWVKGQQQSQEHDLLRVNEIWRDRYIGEMEAQSGLIAELRGQHEVGQVITLLCSCHRPEECHRSVLRDLILGGRRTF